MSFPKVKPSISVQHPLLYVFFCYILLKPNRNIWKQLKIVPPNCAQTDKQCVRLCLIWPNSPPKTVLRKNRPKRRVFPDERRLSRADRRLPDLKSSFFFLPQKSDVPRILPFRHIHLLLCLVSHRLFILAFISAITAVPIWSLRAKWKPVVSLRCRLKVSACNGSWHFFPTAFLQHFGTALQATIEPDLHIDFGKIWENRPLRLALDWNLCLLKILENCLTRKNPSLQVKQISNQQHWQQKEWFYWWRMLPCLEERNALLLMWVLSVWRLCCFSFLASVVPRRWWMAIGIVPVAMSLEVAYSVLPSMIYDKKVRGNLWLHHLPSCTFPFLPKRSSGESDWHSNRTHLVRCCGQAPPQASKHSV